MIRPVFIIGSPRSGTSVFTWALGQHPNLYPLEETVWFGKFVQGADSAYRQGSSRGERSQLSAMEIGRETFFEALGSAIHRLIIDHRSLAPTPVAPGVAFARQRHPDEPKQRWVDGTPQNSFDVERILLLWPESTFIHLVRDVQEVVRSLVQFSRAGGRNHSVDEAYRKWLRHVQACRAAERELGPDRVLRLYQANLAAGPRPVLERALTHVGEDWAEPCLAPLEHRINSSRPTTQLSIDDRVEDPEIRQRALELWRELDAERPVLEGAS